MVVGGLLLAAGAGRRMGRPKALLRGPDGVPWVAAAVRVLAAGGCDPVLVVVGAEAEEVAALVPPPALVVVADGWVEGMGASLRTGLAELAASAGPEVEAVLVGLVDTPGVTPAVAGRLVATATGPASAAGAATHHGRGTAVLLRAGYGGVPGHPVVLGRDHWAGVAATARGDAGARAYLAGHVLDLVECGDVGDGRDVDEPDSGGGP
jgi:CTP:molybdopterin cytidylyltransferase MocA